MKKNKSLIFITLALVAAMLILLTMSNQAASTNEASSQISVIVDDSNSERWVRFRAGLDQAAKDYNVNLNYVTTTENTDLEQQKAAVDKEIENGTNAVILQLVSNSSDVSQYINEVSKKTTLELIETDLSDENADKSYFLTLADNQGMGTALGEMILDGSQEMSSCSVGIITGNSAAMPQRLQGLQEKLMKENITIAWTVQTANEAMMKREISPVNIITVLDNDTLQDTAALLKDAKKDAKIYGVGCSDKTIYNLDNGKIDGMVVPNEYTMGYVSLLKAAMRVKNRLYKVEDTSVNFFKITKENLYSTENQKMIFPIVG